MATVATKYEHIAIGDEGVPVILGANMKVTELIAETVAYGWSPEELHFQHPHLSMGQIHSALAYYWDHADSVDQDLEKRLHQAEQLRQVHADSSVAARLKSRGLL
jgi:uncharacterized protein (DUF433 family)